MTSVILIRERPTRIENIFIPGPAGSLEALLEWDPDTPPRFAALVCHPHPQFGGTMHNKVVFRAAKAAVHAGMPALRFNFRGVGASQGTYDEGAGERDDVRAALHYVLHRFATADVCLMGFSFGSWVGMAVGCEEARVRALVGLGLPLSSVRFGYLCNTSKPKLIVQGTEDIYGPRDQVHAFFDTLAEPKRIHWVEGADHFFTGRLEEVQGAIRAFLEECGMAAAGKSSAPETLS